MKGFIVLVVVVVLGYYVYKTFTAPESCKETFNHCMNTCRRTTTEAPASQACQEACRRDLDACGRRGS